MTWNKTDTNEYYFTANNGKDMSIFVKWDGCCEIYKHHNGAPFEDRANAERIHICYLNDFIKELSELKKEAKEYFKNFDEWSEQ